MATSTLTPTVAVTAPVTKPQRKKPTNKRNGKKVMDTINVPSQIGNIQISQVSGKASINSNCKTTAIENQIQITPILDNSKMPHQSNIGLTSAHQHQTTQIQFQQQPPNALANSQSIAINLNQSQQILSIPNNVQIITSSSNNLNTQPLLTNAISQPQSDNVLISTQSQMQSTNVQNIQGSLINSSVSQSNQQQSSTHRQLHTMPVQPITSNIQMPMLHHSQQPTTATTIQTSSGTIPQLTGSLTLSLSEDSRFILKHNANAPQDNESQKILQAILSGALCNVTLINEPLHTSQPMSNAIDNKSSIITTTAEMQKIAGTENKCVVSLTFCIIYFPLLPISVCSILFSLIL